MVRKHGNMLNYFIIFDKIILENDKKVSKRGNNNDFDDGGDG